MCIDKSIRGDEIYRYEYEERNNRDGIRSVSRGIGNYGRGGDGNRSNGRGGDCKLPMGGEALSWLQEWERWNSDIVEVLFVSKVYSSISSRDIFCQDIFSGSKFL